MALDLPKPGLQWPTERMSSVPATSVVRRAGCTKSQGSVLPAADAGRGELH